MKRNQPVFALAILLALILATAVVSLAQVNAATLSGLVMDPQGLGIKSATVTLTNKATGAARSTVCDDNGHYSFVSLTPGSYKVSVDGGSGFSPLTAEDLIVEVGGGVRYHAKLSLRRASEDRKSVV